MSACFAFCLSAGAKNWNLYLQNARQSEHSRPDSRAQGTSPFAHLQNLHLMLAELAALEKFFLETAACGEHFVLRGSPQVALADDKAGARQGGMHGRMAGKPAMHAVRSTSTLLFCTVFCFTAA